MFVICFVLSVIMVVSGVIAVGNPLYFVDSPKIGEFYEKVDLTAEPIKHYCIISPERSGNRYYFGASKDDCG